MFTKGNKLKEWKKSKKVKMQDPTVAHSSIVEGKKKKNDDKKCGLVL